MVRRWLEVRQRRKMCRFLAQVGRQKTLPANQEVGYSLKRIAKFSNHILFENATDTDFVFCVFHPHRTYWTNRRLQWSNWRTIIINLFAVLQSWKAEDQISGMILCTFLGRPYGVTGGLMKCSWCFLFFQRVISELPRPITAKLRHMIGTGVYFINWL